MSGTAPSISIVITTFNRASIVGKAIRSALAWQDTVGGEVIAVDDGSTDGTVAALRTEFAAEIAAGRLVLVAYDENRGVTAAKNTGFLAAKGDWAVFLDSDDTLVVRSAAAVAAELAAEGQTPVVFFRCADERGIFVGRPFTKPQRLDLRRYLAHTSYGEALTAINKRLAPAPPFDADLRGYEGLGCARLIAAHGPALLSTLIARRYSRVLPDRLSSSRGVLHRAELIGRGHFRLIGEFRSALSIPLALGLVGKALIYELVGLAFVAAPPPPAQTPGSASDGTLPLTLLNPHADDFIKTPLSFRLVGRRGLQKYGYLIDEPVKSGRRVDILIDGSLSSLIQQNWFAWLPAFLRRALLRVEVALWVRINGLADAVTVHWSPATILDRRVLYLFSYKNCAGNFKARRAMIDAFPLKIVNMSHYFILTAEKSHNMASLRGVIYAAEADLRDNPYFRKYFAADRPILALPFAVAPRFRLARPLADRAATCAATGSFHNLHEERPKRYYRDFLDFFNSSTYHPVRKLIYDRRKDLGSRIVSRVSPYREGRGNQRFLENLIDWLGLDVTQREYFSFDIVEFYNGYVFALVGEELPGLPAIGFFEALACGCVLLGQGTDYYRGLGLIPGEHYLDHDGTIAGILAAMDAALAQDGCVARISAAALDYATQHCRTAPIWAALQESLLEIAASTEPAAMR